jgi:hypothetical protein
MKDYLTKAIKKLKPSAEFSFQEDNYSTIKWDVLEGKPPTQAEIKQLQSRSRSKGASQSRSRRQTSSIRFNY